MLGKSGLLFAGCAAIVFAWLLPAANAQAQQLEELVVTARKREENLQTVPLAVTALSAVNLERHNVLDLSDVASLAPGLTYREFGSGRYGTPVIRGIAPQNLLTDTGAVGVFLDGLFLSNRHALNLQLLDLARIEVVKGPQSTLYGQSTFAGAINYVTMEPSMTPGASASVTVGSDELLEGKARVTGPIVKDYLAASLAVSANRFGGTFTNSAKPSEDINGYDSVNLSGSLLYDHGRLKIAPAFYYSRDDRGPGAQVPLTNNCGRNAGGFATMFCGEVPATRTVDLPPDTYGSKRRSLIATLPMTLKITDSVTLNSLTGYINSKTSSLTDFYTGSQGTAFTVRNTVTGATRSQRLNAYYGLGNERDRTFSQELRLAFEPSANFRVRVGGFYFRNSNYGGSTINVDGRPLLPNEVVVGTAAPFVTTNPLVQRASSLSDLRSEVVAAFGDVQWTPVEGLRLGAEIRRNRDRRSIQRYPTYRVNDTSFASATFKNLTPRFTVDYSPVEETMIYASAAKGARAGGFNSVFSPLYPGEQNFKEETNWTYELGVKSRFLENRLLLNASVFNIDWSGLQLRGRSLDPAVILTLVRNVGAARSRGFEVETSFAVTEGVTISANYAYTDAKFKAGSADLGGVAPCGVDGTLCKFTASGAQDIGGLPLPLSVKHQANASIDVRRPLNDKLGWYTVADVSYTGKSPMRAMNVGPVVPSFTLANLKLGLTWSRFDLSIWAKNLFDKKYAISAFSDGALTSPNGLARMIAFQGNGRIVGATLSATY